ncbi:MAG: hypothetical protein R2747_24800 [Pyrinomonadaceae bacterium]
MNKHEALEVLLKRRGELKKQNKAVSDMLIQQQQILRQYLLRLEVHKPWWKKLLRLSVEDDNSRALRASISKYQQESNSVEREIRSLTNCIKTARHIKKRFKNAIKIRALARRRNREADKKIKEFVKTSEDVQKFAYNRHLFKIRKQDYKRGNLLDNHFRKAIASQVLTAFDNKCLICKVSYDLTFDHFAIPKNEGGNFILLLNNDNAIKINIVILCRSCNAAKGESYYLDFFDSANICEAAVYQQKLLDFVLGDLATLKVLKKWYK